ncbi:MAG: hypothetical protein K6F94_01855, partial [Bacteroidaceae bacterium]|nr:hypothetical protein [Bacteroidaceae bacterium]
AFASCSKLTDCYCYASTVPTTSTIAFTNQYIANATLHVPAELIEDYNCSDPWYNFGQIVAMTEEEEKLPVNGIMVSPVDNIIFSLDGRPIQKPQHGIYIVNGKKVVIK